MIKNLGRDWTLETDCYVYRQKFCLGAEIGFDWWDHGHRRVGITMSLGVVAVSIEAYSNYHICDRRK